MAVELIRPGSWTTIQDRGRYGWRRYGISVSGAMDSLALRVANMLVGNLENAAALEMTLIGPTLRFTADAVIAICGANLDPQIAGESIPGSRPVWLREGSELRFGAATSGCRAYLAVAGGFEVAELLGSRSYCEPAGSGGLAGRSLQAGDRLGIGCTGVTSVGLGSSAPQVSSGNRSWLAARWCVAPGWMDHGGTATIRVISGRQANWFGKRSQQRFYGHDYAVTPQSNRMGYRLAGPRLELENASELLSEAVSVGAVQVPPDGQPLVLMADCPVTGGYPKIAHVAAVDLTTLAQLRPGSSLRFREVTLAEAQRLYRTREEQLFQLRLGIEWNRQRHGFVNHCSTSS